MVSRKRYLELEAQAEIKAVIELGSTSFLDILRINKLEEAYPSFEYKRDRKGVIIATEKKNVRGQDVVKITTWNKFLAKQGYVLESLISLTDDAERLTEEYYTFLTTSHTDVFINLDMEGKKWLRKVVRLAVKFHLMNNKFDRHVEALKSGNHDEDYMCSDFAAFGWHLLDRARISAGDSARVVNHIIEEPDKAKLFIRDFYDENYKRLHEYMKLLNHRRKAATEEVEVF